MKTAKAPYQRYLEGSRLYYDVLCSKGTFYYTVEMLGLVAISCECRAGEFGQGCKHKKTAEKAEQALSLEIPSRNSAEVPNASSVKEERALPPLNGNRAFSILR